MKSLINGFSLGVPEPSRQTATEVRVKQDVMRRAMMLVAESLQREMRNSLFGAPPMPFPERFLRLHKDMLEQMYYSHGDAFEIKTLTLPMPISNPDLDAMALDAQFVIGVSAVQLDDGIHFSPYGIHDAMAAERWERAHANCPDDLFTLLLPEARIPT